MLSEEYILTCLVTSFNCGTVVRLSPLVLQPQMGLLCQPLTMNEYAELVER
jgi:hypothetical protein